MAFTGDRSRVKQLDPGKFLDESTGNYWSGSNWDDAQDWGKDSTFGTKPPIAPTNPYPGGTPPTITPPPSGGGQNTTQSAPQGGGDWSTGTWDANRVNSYFQSRGVAPNSTSPDYWAGKWNEWGKSDPAYFLSRLSTADEFNPGGKPGSNPAMAAGGMDYAQALGKVQAAVGRTLSPSEIDAAFAKFGGTRADSFTDAGLAPVIQYFKGQATQANPNPPTGPTSNTSGAPHTTDGNGNITASGPEQGIKSELYNMLLDRAHQGTNISPNDPNIRAQADPYAAQTERERRNYMADTAEKAGPNANLRGEARVSAERAGQANGLFESQLVGRELQAKRDEIQQALTQLGGQLTADQQLALQKELGYLNDATQRYGMDQNYTLGTGRLGLDTELGRGNLTLGNNRLGLDRDLGLGNLLLGRDRLGLDKDKLGLDYSDLDWRMDPRNPANLPR